MSGAAKVVTPTATGIAILPDTGSNTLLTILSYGLIAIGIAVLISFVSTRLYTRFSR